MSSEPWRLDKANARRTAHNFHELDLSGGLRSRAQIERFRRQICDCAGFVLAAVMTT